MKTGPASSPTGTPAQAEPSQPLPDMLRPPERYLTPDERDFFAVYARGKW